MDDNPIPLKLAHPGGRRVKGQRQPDNVRYGNSRVYIEARLTRDAEEGCREAGILLAGIRSGAITHHQAAIVMSYTRPREPNGRGSENVAKAKAWALHKLFHPRPDKGKAPPAGANGA